MIGVVGASARAAVMTAARAGESCWAVDLFNDRDLKRLAPCVRCPFEHFPQAIPELAKRFPPGPVLCTGGLENHPDVLAELLRSRELLGPDPDAVRRVRDPFHLPNRPLTLLAGSVVPEHENLSPGFAGERSESKPRSAVLTPGEGECLRNSEATPSPVVPVLDARARRPLPRKAGGEVKTGGFLIKSLRSSGGLGVRFAIPGEVVPEAHVAQQFIDGPAMSAVFHDDVLLGVTEQLIGTPWLHAKPFHYAGTLYEPGAQARVIVDPLLAFRARLKNFHGIDFILHQNTPFILEINPRYPASVECIEFANHLGCTVGKAIWFAPHSIRFPNSGPWDDDLAGAFDPWKLPSFADIPDPGEPFEAGNPVITFFATGRTVEECRDRLQSRTTELDRLFARTLP